jgi:nucleoside-diphosphate-sugar epimerase
MAKKYLITGGSGFIGSAIVRQLIQCGQTVKVLDNNIRGSRRKLEGFFEQIEFIEGDIRDSALVNRIASGIDSIIHLAYINGTEFFYNYPELVLDVAVRGILNVLDACKTNGIKELVLASSSEVYQTPPYVPTDEKVPLAVPDVLNPRYSYGGGKILCELMALNYGRKNFERVLVFRPHNVYGPDMGWEHVIPQLVLRAYDLIKQAPASSEIILPIQGDGSQTRAFIHIDDFTQGFMTILQKGEHLNIYNIGNQDEVTIKDLATKVISCLGKEGIIVEGLNLPLGGTPRRCPDISKLKNLGFKATVGLDQGLALTADWYVKHQDLRSH